MEKRYFNPEFQVMPAIEARIQSLIKLKERLEIEYEKMPEGSILAAFGNRDTYFRYYLRKTPQDGIGVYLDASKGKIKKQLSVKKYYSVMLIEISKEIKQLEAIRKMNLQDSIITSFEKMHPGIKELITPINIDDELFVKKWMSEPFEGLGFDPNDTSTYYSNRNERMRSKSEMLIANALDRMNIPYKYECPLHLSNGQTLYPDFTVLDVRHRKVKYWEHLGRMGDMSYVARNMWKLDEYKKMDIRLGISLFVTYENGITALGKEDIDQTIEAILK